MTFCPNPLGYGTGCICITNMPCPMHSKPPIASPPHIINKIEDIATMLAGISQGQWKTVNGHDIYSSGYYIGTTKGNDTTGLADLRNAEFIAAAPEIIRFLLNKIDLTEHGF